MTSNHNTWRDKFRIKKKGSSELLHMSTKSWTTKRKFSYKGTSAQIKVLQQSSELLWDEDWAIIRAVDYVPTVAFRGQRNFSQ